MKISSYDYKKDLVNLIEESQGGLAAGAVRAPL